MEQISPNLVPTITLHKKESRFRKFSLMDELKNQIDKKNGKNLQFKFMSQVTTAHFWCDMYRIQAKFLFHISD